MRVQRYIKYLKPANKKCLISGILVFLCKIRRNGRKKTVTKNLSSAIIIFGIAVLMVFVSSPDYKKFILIGLAGIAVCALAVYLIVNAADSDSLSFRGGRILAWLDPEAYADGKGFQTLQALYAIGSGGIWGKGLGQSMQKLGFLPEAQNDMIFSIICEELGLFGGIAVIVMFILLIWRLELPL